MNPSAPLPVTIDLLETLRGATGPRHESLDALFGALDLMARADLARFLAAHAIGMKPLEAAVRSFAKQELGTDLPDYGALLSADLAELGVNADRLPAGPDDAPRDAAAPLAPDAAAGIAYVVLGSRLGLAMMRRGGYWGEASGFRSRYMEDQSGQAAWKALVPVLRQRPGTGPAATAAASAAVAAFETFARAFDASRSACGACVDG